MALGARFMQSAPRARIDLSALRHNLAQLRRLAPAAQLLAVVKANAYGHGLLPVVEALDGKVDALGVSRLTEALTLRRAGCQARLVVMAVPGTAAVVADCLRHDLDLVVHNASGVAAVLDAQTPGRINIWLKLDSGMHRLGLAPWEYRESLRRLSASARVDELICMTHLSSAEHRVGDGVTERQLALFEQHSSGFSASLANSAALLNYPSLRRGWLRPGLALYGVSPLAAAVPDCELRAVLQLEAPVLSVQRLGVGEPVGYGAHWRSSEPCTVATVAIGYGDGYPCVRSRSLPALLRGRRIVASVGQVSMDMTTFRLLDGAEAAPGELLTLWGQNLPVAQVAAAAGRLSYELLSGLSARVERCYQ